VHECKPLSAGAEALHRDLGDALDAARRRLEADVRALEENAASNIAAHKLEEEVLRAELDDGMLRVDEAVDGIEASAATAAAAATATFAAATAEVEALIADSVAPVDQKIEELAGAYTRPLISST